MKQKTKLWEYLITTDLNNINELGSNGWELVSVVYFPAHEAGALPISYILITNYYFKRQLR